MEHDEIQRCLEMSLMSDQELMQQALNNSMAEQQCISRQELMSEQERLYNESLEQDKKRQKNEKQKIKFDDLYEKQMERIRGGEKLYSKIIVRYMVNDKCDHITLPFFESDKLSLLYRMLRLLLHNKSFFLFNHH